LANAKKNVPFFSPKKSKHKKFAIGEIDESRYG